MRSVVLIELYPWHGECLYSQVLFLKNAGWNVHLICNEKLKLQTKGAADIADHILYTNISLRTLISIRRYILKHKIDRVIFNTAQGDRVLKLCLLPFPSRVKFHGTLHDTRKLLSSTGQGFISRKVKRYYTLASFISQNMQSEPRYDKFDFEYFYPLFLPPYHHAEVEKADGDIWILVPGSVEFTRRDYMALLGGGGYDKRIKFVILGNSNKADGPKIKELVEKQGLRDSFIFFDSYVNTDLFNSYAAKSDYVALLIHEDNGDYQGYLNNKVSGSMNIALSLRLPMLCSHGLESIDDIARHSLFYSPSDFASFVNALPKPSPGSFYVNNDTKYGLEEQTRRYTGLLEG